jgi:hypothetical protein
MGPLIPNSSEEKVFVFGQTTVRCLGRFLTLSLLLKSANERNACKWIQSHRDISSQRTEFIAAEAEAELNSPDEVGATGKEIDAIPAEHGRARQDVPSTSGLVHANPSRAE